MTYRGPQPNRLSAQFGAIAQYHAETATWRAFVSAETANASAYFAGAGTVEHWRETTISGLFALARGNMPAFREHQTPGGMVQAGDAMVSTFQALGDRDIVLWNGVRYTVDGDSVPVHFGGRVWYRAVLSRGDE